MRSSDLFIDGKFVPAASGATFENINPATEEVLGVAADAGRAELEAAVAAARRAFDDSGWSRNAAFRAACLRQLQDGLARRVEEIRPLVVAEAGAPVMLTHLVQVDPPIADLGYVADLAETYDYERPLPDRVILGTASRRTIRREAAGVAAAITPWNFPFLLNLAKLAPALAAGCTVVLKPAPDTPWSAAVIGRIIAEETDIPPGVCNIVTSSDHAVGEQLAGHPDVDIVTFTGSTATGRRVMATAAATVKRTLLELGGKSPAIFLDDADLAAHLPAVAAAACLHAGQGCALLTRILVPRSRRDEAVELAAGCLQEMSYGDPTEIGPMMGPLISARQLNRVLGYIETGKSEGRLVVGGRRAPQFDRGYWVEPTLFADVAPDARIAQEEIFGPVVVIIPFADDDDAVRIANSTIYGLSGAVHSADTDRALAVARRLRTGTVSVQGAQWYAPDTPFGGYRQSGLGREGGVLGFEEYLEVKTIAQPA
ncbi:MAG: aldehyde dehydrogenase family protein [Actinomycetota bacterium]|jgi:aldehyde dehydrogenase (NAD+)